MNKPISAINKLYKYKYVYRYNVALDATKSREIQVKYLYRFYFSEAYTFYFRGCDKKQLLLVWFF